jgi:hypothetical protein
MDEVNSGPALLEDQSIVDDFWSIYNEFGILHAVAYMDITTGGDVVELESHIPALMNSAEKHGVSLIEFVKEWDEHMEKSSEEPTPEVCEV